MNDLKRLFPYIKLYRMTLAIIVLFSFISTILLMIAPTFIGNAIDFSISKGNVDFNSIIHLIMQLLVLYVLSYIFSYISFFFTSKVANSMTNSLRKDCFLKLQEIKVNYYDANSYGNIMSKLTNDIEIVGDGLFQILNQMFNGIIIIFSTLFFMFRLNVVITFVVLLITPISFLISSFIVRHSSKYFRENANTLGELNGFVEEMIGGEKVIKAFNYEETSFNKFKEINDRLYVCGQKSQFFSSLTNPSTRFINNISYIIVGVVAGLLRAMSIGNISAFLTYAVSFARPINDITSITVNLQSAFASLKRVIGLLDEDDLETEGEELKGELAVNAGNVEFKNVNFSYDKDKELIKDLNFKASSGEKIAIVGPTGAGKTTLVNLLMRFYDPDSGEIDIDSKNIDDFKRDGVRRSFGMVLQDTWLFSGTIKENIAYGKEGATLDEIVSIAKFAYADDFIKRLQNGYDTFITEDGEDLSQGERQLLTIARAMISNPPMLILDEATSSIDTLTEKYVQSAFLSMMKGRTSFIIAHRLSTIRDANLILFIKDGKIVEQGNHDELILKRGFYYNLLNSSK
ncbi:MAG: ABC transporter ATP-binding protein/permease [Oscillospiraceae bacterium]|nr:ABC transporter ATP-binding protein/permease [Oscillospiraceae bacterium]